MVRKRKRAEGKVGVYFDSQKKTCLLVETGVKVKFIPLDIVNGFEVHETTMESFNQRYFRLPDYPIEIVAKLYLNYILAIGANDEVVDYISAIVHVTNEDRGIIKEKAALRSMKAKTKNTKAK